LLCVGIDSNHHGFFRGTVALRRGFQRWKALTDSFHADDKRVLVEATARQKIHFLIEADSSKLQSTLLNPSVVVQNINREALNAYRLEYMDTLHRLGIPIYCYELYMLTSNYLLK
jgi:hypothetical protein